jgi:hypothetical protein
MIAKAMDPVSGYGWNRATAEEIAQLYRVFLFLCLNHPQQVIVPIREVDEFWHLHILDTENYHSDCQKIFGYYLHHFPYAGLDKNSDKMKDEQRALEETLQLVQKYFPHLVN